MNLWTAVTDWDEVSRAVLYFTLIQHSRTYDSDTVFVCVVKKAPKGAFLCVLFCHDRAL